MLMFSCRFETKCARMHQILFQFHFFLGVTPGPPPLGALPPDPRGGEGRERERGGDGKGKEGREGEVCVIAVVGIDAPALDPQFVCFLNAPPWPGSASIRIGVWVGVRVNNR